MSCMRSVGRAELRVDAVAGRRLQRNDEVLRPEQRAVALRLRRVVVCLEQILPTLSRRTSGRYDTMSSRRTRTRDEPQSDVRNDRTSTPGPSKGPRALLTGMT